MNETRESGDFAHEHREVNVGRNGNSPLEEAPWENCNLHEVVRTLCGKINSLVDPYSRTSLCVCTWRKTASFFTNGLAAEAPGTAHQSGQPATFSEVLLQHGATVQPAGWPTISEASGCLPHSRFLQPKATTRAVRVPLNAVGQWRQQWESRQPPGRDGGYPLIMPPSPNRGSEVHFRQAKQLRS